MTIARGWLLGCARGGGEFAHEPDANMIYAALPRHVHQRLHDGGAVYHLMSGPLEGDPDEMVVMRLVCDWSISHEQIDAFLGLLG